MCRAPQQGVTRLAPLPSHTVLSASLGRMGAKDFEECDKEGCLFLPLLWFKSPVLKGVCLQSPFGKELLELGSRGLCKGKD